MKLCVKNGLIVSPTNFLMSIGDIWISNGRISTIDMESECIGMIPPDESEDVQIIDATGKLVVPGFIDLHVHFRDPGFEYKEDINSGCKAAARGGFTTVCCMPNTNPPIHTGKEVEYINEKANGANGVKVLSFGTMSMNQEGRQLSKIDEMVKAGIRGISEDGMSLSDSLLMLNAMKKAKENNIPVFSHAEDQNMGNLPIGEALIIGRDIILAKETGCQIHFCHVSTKGGVELIKKAKSEGVRVTAETAPHYFILNEDMVNKNANRKMNPPLRNNVDVEAIINGIKDGTIDVIATDHAPHSRKEKEVTFELAPNGVVGLETSFAASYTKLVETGLISLSELIQLMSSKPAKILGIEGGEISPGKTADIAIIDVEKSYKVAESDLISKGKNSPFLGLELYGRILYTIKQGEIIYEY